MKGFKQKTRDKLTGSQNAKHTKKKTLKRSPNRKRLKSGK